MKSLALRAARQAGWSAQTEVSGAARTGDAWTADVLASKAGETIAVEIQWSSQTDEETWRRQRRYRDSGVLGVWLLRQPNFPVDRSLPAACLCGSLDDGLDIRLPCWPWSDQRHRSKPDDWLQALDPEVFFRAVFSGQFRFGIDAATTLELAIQTGVMTCWKCDRDTRIVTFLEGQLGPHVVQERYDILESLPGAVEELGRALAHRPDIGPVRSRYSRTVEHAYLSNGCAHCGALLGRFYEPRAYYSEQEVVGFIQLPLDAHAREVFARPLWGVWTADTPGAAQTTFRGVSPEGAAPK